MSQTMKEAIVSPDLSVEIKDSPVPTTPPTPTDLIIKVVVSGTNPKDWKYPEWQKIARNSGDDIAGVVVAVGSEVTNFHPGDRVWAFHTMLTPYGSFAEYAVAPQHTTGHLPHQMSFEEGATVPLAALTAGVALFVQLGLPMPWQGGAEDGFAKSDASSGKTKTPLQRSGPVVIYGAATAIGLYAIQLCKRAGVGPLICVAGSSAPFVEQYIDVKSGDVIVDYRNGDEALVAGIQAALKPNEQLMYCFDAVSEGSSTENMAKIIKAQGARIARVLPHPNLQSITPPGVDITQITVGWVHDRQRDFGAAMTTLLTKGLGEGWFKPHPHTVVPGGLAGVQEAMRNLKAGKANATKYVLRIMETPGVVQ